MELLCVQEHFWIFYCLIRRKLYVPFLNPGIAVRAIYGGRGGSALSVVEFCLWRDRYPGGWERMWAATQVIDGMV